MDKDELVDVYLKDFDSVELHPNDKHISTKIHQNVWEKNYYNARAKDGKEKLTFYEQYYASIPSGRVNFNEIENRFEVMIADWFDSYPNLKDEIMLEFQLPADKTVFKKVSTGNLAIVGPKTYINDFSMNNVLIFRLQYASCFF